VLSVLLCNELEIYQLLPSVGRLQVAERGELVDRAQNGRPVQGVYRSEHHVGHCQLAQISHQSAGRR